MMRKPCNGLLFMLYGRIFDGLSGLHMQFLYKMVLLWQE
jgi:hypothetical protein